MPFIQNAQFSMTNTMECNLIRTYAPQFKFSYLVAMVTIYIMKRY